MTELYFQYTCLDGYCFKGFVQTIEVSAKGVVTIWFGKEVKEFIPKDGDVYQMGESYTWMILNDGNRWFQQ